MVKLSYSGDSDRFDEKTFRESLGSFGTGTMPGGDQLVELQAKIRQGVKHVELNLNSAGKGEFGKQDVPDKYGFQERRTIMQLAKLNNVNLSIHAPLNLNSLSGFTNQGFDEAQRWDSLREIEESVRFAAQTAKGGAIVMHLQGEGIGARAELSLSKKYLDWLKENRKDEYNKIKSDYFVENPSERLFVNNPERKFETKIEYQNLDSGFKSEFEKKYSDEIKKGKNPWDLYFKERQKDKMKLSPDLFPAVVVGENITKVDRSQEFIDLTIFRDSSKLNDDEKKILSQIGVNYGDNFSISDFQKAMAVFSNGKPADLNIDEKIYNEFRNKVLINYDKVLSNNEFLQNQADADFFKKLVKIQIDINDLQKKNLEDKREMFKDDLDKINILEKEAKEAYNDMVKIKGDDDIARAKRDAYKNLLFLKNQELQKLKYESLGQENYHELANYDEKIAEINKKKKELSKQEGNASSLSEVTFEKNISGLSFTGIKAMQYQIDLKNKAEEAKTVLPKLKKELEELKNKYYSEKNYNAQDKLAEEISKKEYEMSKWVGMKDYDDIDLINNPLYIAPENMLPGMGNLTSIEDFKAVVRMGQQDFVKKILSGEPYFENIKKEYEKVTGKKINNEKDALELAKRHLSGTFDTAHATAWLKHFNRLEGESDDARFDRFQNWLKDQTKVMAEEGLIKHVHFNNSTGKDDDHNLIGSGILDMHGFKKIFRDAGIKEPFILEAGGRGSSRMMHMTGAFNMFNPTMGGGELRNNSSISSGVSDWISVNRTYERRPVYSAYGMGTSTFRHTPPQQNQEKGDWSGTGFF